MKILSKIAAATLVAAAWPALVMAQSGEFGMPSSVTTTQSAVCGRNEVSLSLRSSPEGVTAIDIRTPGTDAAAMTARISREVADLKLVSQIRIYCGESYLFEILGYRGWTGPADAPMAPPRFLAVAGNYLTRLPD